MIERHSFAQTITAHLLPGVLVFVVFVPATRVVLSHGLPPPLALFLTMLLVLIPCELAVLLKNRKKTGPARSWSGLIPYAKRLSVLQYAMLVPLLLVWAFLCFFLLAPLEESFLAGALFPWPPSWLIGPTAAPAASRAAWIATMVLGLVVNGIAVPIVEELYFRGYLLPRIPANARWAPLVNAALFSLYHFFSPWQNLARTLAVAPIAYVVSWKRSVWVGLLTHCLLNTIAMGLALASLLS